MNTGLLFTRFARRTTRAKKIVATLLATFFFKVSLVGAASLPPGSMAILEPHSGTVGVRAAWDQVERRLYMDPLLLVKGKEQVAHILGAWEGSGAAINSSHLTAYRTSMNRAEKLLAGAWDAYYGFEYEKALVLLAELEKLLSNPGDTAHHADKAFEKHILKGVVLRTMGKKGYRNSFTRAAALDLDRQLPQERFSPQVVEIFRRIQEEVSGRPKGTLQVSGSPADASVLVNGKHNASLNESVTISEGTHFLELKAPGYEPWYTVVQVDRYAPVNISYDLVSAGPTGEPGQFFLDRLQAADRNYLSTLARRLGVDYIMLPQVSSEPVGDTLEIWLIDGEGRTVDHRVAWNQGDGLLAAIGPVEAMVEPLRQSWSDESEQDNLSLPEAGPIPGEGRKGERGLTAWRKYALVIGAVLLLGGASSSRDSGGTKVEVTW